MKLLREPLLHFLIAGSLLFGVHEWMNHEAPISPSDGPVRVGEGEVRWLQETFANQWRRKPTEHELSGLVATLLEEQLLAREARALGLDQNDTIIRRRLAQKLNFLVEDTSYIADPEEADLRRYFTLHADRYRTEARLSLNHIFFSPERRTHADTDARTALTQISAANDQKTQLPPGDRLLLDDSLSDVDIRAVSGQFGAEFADAVFALPPGPWSGPIRSAFGVHLVQVTQLRHAEPRRFEEVREVVLADWRRERQSETKQAYLDRLQEKFGVVVDDRVRSTLNRMPAQRAAP